MNFKYINVLLISFLISQFPFAQSSQPVRTEWRSPDDSKPTSYLEWKTEWEAQSKIIGGEVKYRSAGLKKTTPDSFSFGNDYAHFMGFVRHSDNSLCTDLPPTASFIVNLNRDDSKILTDDAPRWSFGDPNISGMGWYGIELGNFTNPEIAAGDSFYITFTCYKDQEWEQGTYSEYVASIPLVLFPGTLYLQPGGIPLPPDSLKLVREGNQINLNWKQGTNRSYTIYRRSLFDTLAWNFPRYQYEKIVEGIIDSCFYDTTIDTIDVYGYILFAKNITNGITSGRSREINESESIINNVRAIIVQPELYSAIETNLMQMVTDWEDEGAEVIVFSMQFADHAALRDTLKSIQRLHGALLIGNFPVPWFQKAENDGSHYQEYPCDLYYMDLDGIWEDNLMYQGGQMVPGSDGIYDTHFENYPRSTEAPEIVVGRITPTPGMGDAAEIINLYLAKCHNYRQDVQNIRQEFKALAYPDDDWNTWGRDVAVDYISQVYTNYTCIWDINATTANGYRTRLDDNYSLIHVWVHSWERGHAFSENNGNTTQYFYNTQILPSNANANFYMLFACGNSRYVTDKNCGAIYALQTDAGINTIGSTHSGGMLDFDYFYLTLAEGCSYGEAFLKTLQYVGYGGYTPDLKGWYYGVTFNGDPFVVPMPSAPNSVITEKDLMPGQLNLECYPNPFNSSALITFEIQQSGEISLRVFDVLSREVAVLVDGHVNRGMHKVPFNAVNLGSGLYIIELNLNSSGLINSKKLLLIK